MHGDHQSDIIPITTNENNIILGVKKLHPDAIIPKMQREGDAAFDIYSINHYNLAPRSIVSIDCGVGLEIPEGYKVMINGRSGLAKKGIFCHVGTIDPNYKGMVGTILINLSGMPYTVEKGDRVGQISLQKIVPTVFNEVAELTESNRGAQGFGSSGR